MIFGVNPLLLKTKQKDPFYSDVGTLLKFEGADGSTTITDSGPSPKTYSVFGNAQIDTAEPIHDLGSLLLDGSGDYLETGQSADFDFGVSDFTVELSFNPDTNSGNQSLISYGNRSISSDADLAFQLEYRKGNASGDLFFRIVNGTTNYFVWASTTLSSGNSYDIRAYRESGTLYLYIDNVLQDSISASVSVNTPASRVLRVGRFNDFVAPSNYRDFDGHVDELRITKGVARTDATPSFPES